MLVEHFEMNKIISAIFLWLYLFIGSQRALQNARLHGYIIWYVIECEFPKKNDNNFVLYSFNISTNLNKKGYLKLKKNVLPV